MARTGPTIKGFSEIMDSFLLSERGHALLSDCAR